jgi:hypothetical protein
MTDDAATRATVYAMMRFEFGESESSANEIRTGSTSPMPRWPTPSRLAGRLEYVDRNFLLRSAP